MECVFFLDKVREFKCCSTMEAHGIQLQSVNTEIRDAQVKRACLFVPWCSLETLFMGFLQRSGREKNTITCIRCTNHCWHRLDLRYRPQQQVLGLCSDCCFSEVFEEVGQFRGNVDLLSTVHWIWKRHGCNIRHWNKVQSLNKIIEGNKRKQE